MNGGFPGAPVDVVGRVGAMPAKPPRAPARRAQGRPEPATRKEPGLLRSEAPGAVPRSGARDEARNRSAGAPR